MDRRRGGVGGLIRPLELFGSANPVISRVFLMRQIESPQSLTSWPNGVGRGITYVIPLKKRGLKSCWVRARSK